MLLVWLGWHSCAASAARLSAGSTRFRGGTFDFMSGRLLGHDAENKKF
jgi:hypothetical protein